MRQCICSSLGEYSYCIILISLLFVSYIRLSSVHHCSTALRLLSPSISRSKMSYNTVAPYTLSPDGTHYILDRPIEKSDSDDRDYRMIKLKNDLEALIIHDIETDKASAALDVHVGSMSDPVSEFSVGRFFFFSEAGWHKSPTGRAWFSY